MDEDTAEESHIQAASMHQMSMDKSKSLVDMDDYDEETEIEVIGDADEFPNFAEFEKLITTTENLENNRLAEL